MLGAHCELVISAGGDNYYRDCGDEAGAPGGAAGLADGGGGGGSSGEDGEAEALPSPPRAPWPRGPGTPLSGTAATLEPVAVDAQGGQKEEEEEKGVEDGEGAAPEPARTRISQADEEPVPDTVPVGAEAGRGSAATRGGHEDADAGASCDGEALLEMRGAYPCLRGRVIELLREATAGCPAFVERGVPCGAYVSFDYKVRLFEYSSTRPNTSESLSETPEH